MPMIQAPGFNIGFSFGKYKQKTQMCLLITNYGEILPREMGTFLQLAMDEKGKKAYLLDWEEQVLGPDGVMYQVIYEKSCLPVCFTGDPAVREEELESVLNTMFEESFQVKMDFQLAEANKDSTWDRIIVLVSIFSATFLVIALMQYLQARGGG